MNNKRMNVTSPIISSCGNKIIFSNTEPNKHYRIDKKILVDYYKPNPYSAGLTRVEQSKVEDQPGVTMQNHSDV